MGTTRRRFRHSDAGSQALASNVRHGFALNHALSLFHANALYTLIPKNACSTLRLSFAIANGCLDDPARVDWIHMNTQSFPTSSRDAFRADYAFVVLRCPFERLYSAFTDKIVNMDRESWNLFERTARRVFPHDITFRRFVELIDGMPRQALDPHWRPQSDFLLFEDYDDWFSLDDFGTACTVLRERIGLEVIDSRPHLRHDIAAVEKRSDITDAAGLSAFELLTMKREGTLPDIDSLYDDRLLATVGRLYADDIALYSERIGESPLMARYAASLAPPVNLRTASA